MLCGFAHCLLPILFPPTLFRDIRESLKSQGLSRAHSGRDTGVTEPQNRLDLLDTNVELRLLGLRIHRNQQLWLELGKIQKGVSCKLQPVRYY